MATEKQGLRRDSNRLIESTNDNDLLLKFIFQLPPDISNIIQSYDNYLWTKLKLINLLKELPSDILKVIKLYSRIGAFGSHYETICEIEFYHKSVQLWLSEHKPIYKICPHCAGYLKILPINLLCPCQNTLAFKKKYW